MNYSQLGINKNDKRSLLSSKAPDDLMITTSGVPLAELDPNPDLW